MNRRARLKLFFLLSNAQRAAFVCVVNFVARNDRSARDHRELMDIGLFPSTLPKLIQKRFRVSIIFAVQKILEHRADIGYSKVKSTFRGG